MSTWILVANQAEAKLFGAHNQFRDIALVEAFEHPTGRLHEGDLVTDKGAAVFQSTGKGQQRGTGAEVEATEQEAKVFANGLAERLRDGRLENRFEKLVLVCAPAFLGHLREAMDDATAKLVVDEVDKNLAEQPPKDVVAALRKMSLSK